MITLDNVLVLIGVAAAIVAYYLYLDNKSGKNAKLMALRDRLNNFYEPSRFPGDKEPEQRALDILESLVKAGNKFRGEKDSVKVYVIPFRSPDVLAYFLDLDETGKTGYCRKIIPVDEKWDIANEPFEAIESISEEGFKIEEQSFNLRKKDIIKQLESKRVNEVRHMLSNQVIDHENINLNFFLYNYLGIEEGETELNLLN